MASSSHCRVARDTDLDAIQEVPSRTHSLQPTYHRQGTFSSLLSEGSSIYNAAVASPGAEQELGQNVDPNNQVYEVADSDLAPNIAMFVPLKSDITISQVPMEAQSANGIRSKPMSPWRRLQLLSENLLISKPEWSKTGVFLSNEPISTLDGAGQRKAHSANDADNSLISPRWPGNLMSPASPVPPKFPPPVRQPTPPGLPSFGTQEAVCYSTQFQSQPTVPDTPNEQRLRDTVNRMIPGRGGADANRTRSYGGSLRRLFRLSPTSVPEPSTQPAAPRIGRAEDGTAVQGRFPYRQSGHGMNAARHLEDHPFHRRTMPNANTDGSPGPQYGPRARGNPNTKDGHHLRLNPVPPRSVRNPEGLAGSYHLSPSPLPIVPQPAVTARPRSPPPIALFSLPRGFHSSSESRRATGDGVADGTSDPIPAQSQPALVEPMQADVASIEEAADQQEHRSFWSTFCCSMRDKDRQDTTVQPTTASHLDTPSPLFPDEHEPAGHDPSRPEHFVPSHRDPLHLFANEFVI